MAQRTTPRRRAAIYARISQDRNHDELGVDRQVRLCRELAKRHRLEVADVFRDDNISGFTGKHRPGYEAMVDLVKADPSIEVILAFAPDRLTRHPRQLEDLIDLLDADHIEVITHAAGDYDLSTSGGRVAARVVGAVARHESEIKSERTKAKMAEIAGTGSFHGGQRPYGYRWVDQKLVIDPDEATQVRFMMRRLKEGAALRHIAAELTEAGVPTSNGLSNWRFTGVRRILLNPAIAGLRKLRGEVIGEAAWPAIVKRADFDEAVAILSDPARKQARRGRYLLAGLAVTEDGTKMTGASRKDKGFRVYQGPGVSINAADLDEIIVEYVLDFTDHTAFPKQRKGPWPSGAVSRLENELDQLATLRGQGEITLREWMAAKREVDVRLQAARSEAPPAPVMPATIASVLGRKGGLRSAWEGLSHDERRRSLAAVLDRVIVHPVAPGPTRPVSDRIEPVHRGQRARRRRR